MTEKPDAFHSQSNQEYTVTQLLFAPTLFPDLPVNW